MRIRNRILTINYFEAHVKNYLDLCMFKLHFYHCIIVLLILCCGIGVVDYTLCGVVDYCMV